MPEAGETTRGERKFAVALFADLSGYTALCRRLDPEEVEATVGPVIAELRALAEADGGVIANVAGDGFFAIFGVPTAQADAPMRAARAAVAIRAAVSRRNARRPPIRVPDVHIGIAAGEVLVSPSEDHPGWSVIGSTINLASRLCDAAPAGTILVDSTTHRLLGAYADSGRRAVLEVKGHDAAVDAWEISPAQEVFTAAPPTSTPFVGRAAELRILDDKSKDIRATSRSAVLGVRGPAGIGKTRLISAWVGGNALEHRTVWMTCSPPPAGPSLLDVMATLASAGADPPDARLGPTVAAVFRSDPTPAVIASVRAQLAQMSCGEMFVLVLEDFHHASAELQDFVQHLARDPLSEPLLVICAVRDESEQVSPPDLALSALDTESTDELVGAVLGGEMPQWLAEKLAPRIQGHPLLAVQTGAYLREAGIVSIDAGRCEVRNRAALDDLPDSVRLFISARIDRLEPNEKSALQRLSTLGSSWTSEWVTEVLGDAETSSLAGLHARNLVTDLGDSTWQIAHALVQEVAYASLTRRDRALLHRKQLELLPPDGASSARVYHALGWCHAAPINAPADRRDAVEAAAVETLRHASELSRTGAQAAEAALRPIATLMHDIAVMSPDLAARICVLEAQCLVEIGMFDEALRAATLAVDHTSESPSDSATLARALIARGHALSRLRRFESARQAFDNGAQIAERTGDAPAKATALRLMAETWRHSLFNRYVRLIEEAYEAFVECEDEEGAADCARELAYLHSIGPPAIHDRWYQLAIDATSEGDVRGRASLARTRAFALVTRFDFAGAEREARLAIEWAEQSGTADVLSDALASHILSLVALGRPMEAVDGVHRLMRFADSQGNARMALVVSAVSAHVHLRTAGYEAAADELRSAVARVTDFGPSEQRTLDQAQGHVALDRGDWAAAVEHFTRAAELADETGSKLDRLTDELEIMKAWIHLGQPGVLSALERLHQDCVDAEVPLLGSYVSALRDQAALTAGEELTPRPSIDGSCLAERATRADNTALALDSVGQDSANAWSDATELWSRLGYTIWLARAQARTGDVGAANRTLNLLDSPPGARAWALGEAAPS
ncbi:MAG TPA: adenylate/guanylate cyclase domain-containing protein [Mycobacteriales bacterium]|nr:adenylate/guanylate cyclase domain-containing protein [Mycobacteriales bacterium]